MKYPRLSQAQIDEPCPADWNAMTGNEQKRFCDKCTKHVHNVAEMTAEEAETAIASGPHVCCRLTLHDRLGVLTKDGWIPRLLLAGGVAATAAGCAQPAIAVEGAAPVPPAQSESLAELKERAAENLEEMVDTFKEKVLHKKRVYMVAGAMAMPVGTMSGLLASSSSSSKP